MTTEAIPSPVSASRVSACGVAAALAAWVALVALLTLALEPVSRVAVFGPEARVLAAAVAADARIVDRGPGYLIIDGATAGFVARLYAGGAWLVLPRRLGGCSAGPR